MGSITGYKSTSVYTYSFRTNRVAVYDRQTQSRNFPSFEFNIGYDGSTKQHETKHRVYMDSKGIIHSNKALPVQTNTVALLNSVTALCNFSFVTQAVVVLYSS